jgi:DNA-binding response OmpR family regulator
VVAAETRKSIVLVEDEPDTAEMLRLSGYTAQVLYFGEAALACVAEEKPDWVVLDVAMPDISGLDVLARMRGYTDMVVSAKSMEAGLAAGASAYLVKPVTFQELCDAVERVF